MLGTLTALCAGLRPRTGVDRRSPASDGLFRLAFNQSAPRRPSVENAAGSETRAAKF